MEQTNEEQRQLQNLKVESLERLRRNKDFQYLVTELELIKEIVDASIYNEDTDNEMRKRMVMKSNIIKLFQELPEDLIENLS